MTHYFFHVMNDKAVLDDVGIELSNMDELRTEAVRAAGQMLSEGQHTWKGQAWQMIVTDAEGTIVFGINCSIDRHGL